MTLRLELPRWYDLHAHFRQDGIVPFLVADHLAMGCTGVLAMPNTKPPVAKVLKKDPLDCWSIEEYLQMLRNAGGSKFTDIIVPLYLTKDTTPRMIEEGKKSGLLRAAKYYPPHGTTGAEHGVPFQTFIDNGVFKAMEDNGVILNIHGEEHGLDAVKYFGRGENAEEIFYKQRLPIAVDKFPKLKIVGEHITTRVAAEFIESAPANVVATITPQHLIYTVGHLLRGLKYHLYCLPLLKFEEDRLALWAEVTAADNSKFFAGTDSAPHVKKATECGCAAGCYTGAIAPQLYVEAFEKAGINMGSEMGVALFKKFLCTNGPAFYGLPVPRETFTLEKVETEVKVGKSGVTPLPLGMVNDGEKASLHWRIV
jgi:dihydroorotase